jgi:predicted DNA-binding transcriptional regulator AlpA
MSDYRAKKGPRRRGAKPPAADTGSPGPLEDHPTLRVRDVAGMLSVDTRTVHRLVRRKLLPEPLRLGPRLLRWRPSIIRRLLAEREGGAA